MDFAYLRVALCFLVFYGHIVSCDLVGRTYNESMPRHLDERKSSEAEGGSATSERTASTQTPESKSETTRNANGETRNTPSYSAESKTESRSMPSSSSESRPQSESESALRNKASSPSSESKVESRNTPSSHSSESKSETTREANGDSRNTPPSSESKMESRSKPTSSEPRPQSESESRKKPSPPLSESKVESRNNPSSQSSESKSETTRDANGESGKKTSSLPEAKMESRSTPSSSSSDSNNAKTKSRETASSYARESNTKSESAARDKPSSSASKSPPSQQSEETRNGIGAMQKDWERTARKDEPSSATSRASATSSSSSDSSSSQRSKKARVDGELMVSTRDAGVIVNDSSYRSTFAKVIKDVAKTTGSVRITRMRIEPSRRLRMARRNTQEQRLRIDFSIDVSNQQEADRISSDLQSTSRTVWATEISDEMTKRNTPYSMSVLEVSVEPADVSTTPAVASHKDDGLSVAVIVIIVLACLVLFAVLPALFLCLAPAMSAPSKRLRVVGVDPVTHVVKPTVTVASKPIAPQKAWSDASTDASSNMSRSGDSFFTTASDKNKSKLVLAVQTPQDRSVPSLTQARLYEQHPVVATSALTTQVAPIGRTLQMQQTICSARCADMPGRHDVIDCGSGLEQLSSAARAKSIPALAKRAEVPRHMASVQPYTPKPKAQPIQQSLERGAGVRSPSCPPNALRR